MLSKEQQLEIDKYYRAYQNESYRLGVARKKGIIDFFNSIDDKSTLLDVGAGRGEVMQIAKNMGFTQVKGVEVVDYLIKDDITYAQAWDLPFDDNSFEMVTLFDVMEHLLPYDSIPTINELARVASNRVAMTISNKPSSHKDDNLHINIKPYPVWDSIIKSCLPNWEVKMISEFSTEISRFWLCEKIN